jgi:hypothetical protein
VDSECRIGDVERDLLSDRAQVPGSLDKWLQQSERSRKYWLKRLARCERRRAEFEGALSCDATASVLWRDFPVTEQREVLSTIDYVPIVPRKWAIRRAVDRAVKAGSDYRRREEPS